MKEALANFFKNMGKGLSAFFQNLWQDFKQAITKHWVKVIGFLLMTLAPILYVVIKYSMTKPEAWAMPVFVWIPLIVLIIVYWCKIRSYLAVKTETMKVENNLEQGKHASMIIVCTFLQMVMTILPFVIGYVIFGFLEKSAISVKDLFMVFTIFETSGALLVMIDTINNVSKPIEDTEREDNESEETTINV